jgi:2-(3-amino-3-carboxypropyl)histidine synthase
MIILHEPVNYKLSQKKELLSIIRDFNDCFIATTIQYKNFLKFLKTKNKGVILGCNVKIVEKFTGNIILFIGDGVFHALMLKKNYPEKKVIVINPLNLKKKEIKKSDIKKFMFREAIAADKLKNAKNVGVIISTKPGQSKLEKAIELKKDLVNKGKNVYLFLCETINPDEFLNFPKLDVLINTACPRLALDDYDKFPVPIVNSNL